MSYLHSARQSFKSCTQAATPPPPLRAIVLLGGCNCIGSKSGLYVLPAMPGGQAHTSACNSAGPISLMLRTRVCGFGDVQVCVQFCLLRPGKPGATTTHWLFMHRKWAACGAGMLVQNDSKSPSVQSTPLSCGYTSNETIAQACFATVDYRHLRNHLRQGEYCLSYLVQPRALSALLWALCPRRVTQLQ